MSNQATLRCQHSRRDAVAAAAEPGYAAACAAIAGSCCMCYTGSYNSSLLAPLQASSGRPATAAAAGAGDGLAAYCAGGGDGGNGGRCHEGYMHTGEGGTSTTINPVCIRSVHASAQHFVAKLAPRSCRASHTQYGQQNNHERRLCKQLTAEQRVALR